MTEVTRPALVTGASGFIGRHLLRALLGRKRRVYALCRRPDAFEDLGDPGLQVVPGDLEDPASYLRHLDREVTVFHLAGVRSAPGTPSDRMQRVNVAATLGLGRASLQAGVARFVHVATATVFGPSPTRDLTEADGNGEETRRDGYSRSKAAAALGMRALAAEGLRVVSVFPTIVFGPDHPSHPNRVTGQVRRLLRSRVDLVVGGGGQQRNLVLVDDVVKGLLLAETCDRPGEEFLLGGDHVSHRRFNEMVRALARRKARVTLSVPRGAALPAARVMDRLRGYPAESGYETAIGMLGEEWRYSSLKAQRILGYTWTPLREAVLDTLRSLQTSSRDRVNP